MHKMVSTFVSLGRNTTNVINWIFDNLLPPLVRDNRFIMGFIMWLVFGKKYHYYMSFKAKLADMKQEDLVSYYSMLSDTFIQRRSDLNKESITVILNKCVGKRVLEVGCGRGYLARLIVEKNKSVTGLDFAVGRSLECNSKNPRFIEGNAECLPFDDNTFDTVLCTHTLEHVKDIHKALSELRRVANTRIIIVVPKQREYKYTFDLHIHFFPYLHSLQRLTDNPGGEYYEIKNDLLYIEHLQ